jgi:hypothetical protein
MQVAGKESMPNLKVWNISSHFVAGSKDSSASLSSPPNVTPWVWSELALSLNEKRSKNEKHIQAIVSE